MKYLGLLPIILFFCYVHVDSIRFDCSGIQQYHLTLNTTFLQNLNGKDYWIIKHIGYPEKMRKLVYKRVTYARGMLTETTYFMNNDRELTLWNVNYTFQIHDEYHALKATQIDFGRVRYEPSPRGDSYSLSPPFDRTTNGLDKIPRRDGEIAYVHYSSEKDFYIVRSCDGKYATVEVGDHTYRTMMESDNFEFRSELDREISGAIMLSGLQNDVQYDDPDMLPYIFPM